MRLFSRLHRTNDLKKSEKKWELHNYTPKHEICWVFPCIDQSIAAGHINCSMSTNTKNNYCKCQSVIAVNLHKNLSYKLIYRTIQHEVLHAAIVGCLFAKPTLFDETVIDAWILDSYLNRKTDTSRILIKKRRK